MRNGNHGKRGLAALLVLALCVAAMMPVMITSAANIPDSTKTCTLTVTATGNYPEFLAMEVPLRLYKIGELQSDGTAYQGVGAFENMDLGAYSARAAASVVSALAEQAAAIADSSAELAPDAVITLVRGTGSAQGLQQGLYLLHSQSADSDTWTYTTSASLVALPAPTGLSWNYDNVTAKVKQEQAPRTIDLTIEKTLDSYRESLGTAAFVFDVEATLNGENVYSNVLTISFDGEGTKQVLAKGIPAGASVTVTEVYSGASYSPVGSGVVTIPSLYEAAEGEGGAVARFSNEYNGGGVYGGSVVNHYEFDGTGWRVTQRADNTQ